MDHNLDTHRNSFGLSDGRTDCGTGSSNESAISLDGYVKIEININMSKYCQEKNFDQPICVRYCENTTDNIGGKCYDNAINYCFTMNPNGKYPIMDEEGNCQKFLKNYITLPDSNISRLDEKLVKFCEDESIDASNYLISTEHTDLCSCHLKDEIYENYYTSLITQIPNLAISGQGNRRCIFPYCNISPFKTNEMKGGTDKGTGHCYDDLYQELLDPIRCSAQNVAEIGVFSGASCQVWLEYFLNANIYGIDISFDHLIFKNTNERLKYILSNATTGDCLKLLPTSFDFVLDDGSHYPYHQISSAKIFMPLISKNGLYICEDIHQNYLNLIGTEFQKIVDDNNMNLIMYDLRKKKNNMEDDIVAVFKHK